jgi:hypothetical protein
VIWTLESGSEATDTIGVREYDVRLTTMPNVKSARMTPPTRRAERAILPRRRGDAFRADFSLDFASAALIFDGSCVLLELNAI